MKEKVQRIARNKDGSLRKNGDKSREIVRLKTQNPKLNLYEIGAIVNRDYTTVSRTLKRYGIDAKRLNTYREFRADILAGIQSNILENIDKEKINKAGLKDCALAYSMLFDKERLEQNKSTQNIALSGIVEQIDKEESQGETENTRKGPEIREETSEQSTI